MRILVVGAGVAGTATAYFLARDGHAVDVLDRAEAPASEGSYANAGLIHASLAEPWNSPAAVVELLGSLARRDGTLLLNARQLPQLLGWGLRFLYHGLPGPRRANTRLNARLAVYSQRVLGELRGETGIQYDHSAAGLLKLFQSHKRLQAVRATSRMLEEFGVHHHVLTVDELVEREPLLEPTRGELAGAIHYPGDESGCPHLFARELAHRAEALGACFHHGVGVRRLRMQGKRLDRVITDQGDFEADTLIIAAGPEAADLGRGIGLRLPIRPVKGYSTTLPLGSDVPAPSVPLSDDGRKLVINRLGNRLRIAGTAEFAGLDRGITEMRVEQLRRRACETMPALAACLPGREEEPWACLRPMTADGPPILGETPIPNVYLNAGSGHLGWTMAAGSARLVADLVAGRTPEIPVEGFSMRRYRL